MSTYSTNLALELIGTGEQAGVWGTTTNTNLGTLIEQSISGYVTQAVSTGTDTTITIPNGTSGVARNMYIELTGTGGASTNLIVPANKKLYFIFNNSTGAVTVKVSGQTGVSVPTGKKMVLVSNGTDIVNGLNYIADFASNSATITHLSATSATITNLTLTSLVISNLSIASANITTLTGSTQTLSGNLTLSGGTANGVAYLDGSKVLTSGTALTFNGSTLATTGALTVDGNATLGNATTDTVTVNGYMGVGGAATAAAGVLVSSAALSGTGQFGVYSAPTFSSAGTSTVWAFRSSPSTAAAAYTVTQAVGYRANDFTKGAGSTITDLHGFYIADQTQGTNNFGITSLVSSGTNKWNIYASGTAANYFAGNVQFAAGTAAAPALTRFGDDNTGIFFPAADTIAFTEGGVEAARFDSSGNLGIGTGANALTNVLTVRRSGSTQAAMAAGNSNTGLNGTLFGVDTAGNGIINQTQALPLIFSTSSTERMRLDASGNLGIGTASPAAKLETYNSAVNAAFVPNTASTWRVAQIRNDGTGTAGSAAGIAFVGRTDVQPAGIAAIQSTTGGGNTSLSFMYVGSNTTTEGMRLDTSGNLGIGTASPAYKLDVAESGAPTSTNTFSVARISGSDSVANDLTLLGPNTSQVRIKFGDPESATIGEVGYNHSTNSLRFVTNGAAAGVFDSSGNLGLGVTPSAWSSTLVKAIQIADNGCSVSSFTTGNTSNKVLNFNNNAYYDAGGWKYVASSVATSRYELANGEHRWSTAASGTADNAISFTEAMRLDASGNLLVGSSSGTHRLTVTVASGADRDILLAGVSGASNGFRVQWNHAALKTYVSISNIPTSSAGLPSGTLYSDSGTIKIA